MGSSRERTPLRSRAPFPGREGWNATASVPYSRERTPLRSQAARERTLRRAFRTVGDGRRSVPARRSQAARDGTLRRAFRTVGKRTPLRSQAPSVPYGRRSAGSSARCSINEKALTTSRNVAIVRTLHDRDSWPNLPVATFRRNVFTDIPPSAHLSRRAERRSRFSREGFRLKKRGSITPHQPRGPIIP